MKTLASAYFNDAGPFEALPGVKGCREVNHPRDLTEHDILIVHGGGDIHPSLYNKKRSRWSQAAIMGPSSRDEIEWALMKEAVDKEIPIIGICRGAQMLTALYGGHLIQHVNNHAGRGHPVVTYDGLSFGVNSIHHQMMVPSPNSKHRIVAKTVTKLSDVYMDEDTNVNVEIEPEFIHYFEQAPGFAIQWHPEMMGHNAEANRYVIDYIGKELK